MNHLQRNIASGLLFAFTAGIFPALAQQVASPATATTPQPSSTVILTAPQRGNSFSPENPSVHDPVLIKQNDTYYLFCTGRGITCMSSKDLKVWQNEQSVFPIPPQWAVDEVPGFRGSIWAPDISYHNGKYYLYYSCSSFGKNSSSIGVATNVTLDPKDPHFKWEDHGRVVRSVPGRDMWNAIDPNLIVDEEGTPWLVFGSFWEGMKIVKLNPDMLSIAEPPTWATVARRPRTSTLDGADPGDGAIEAPFIFKKGNYFYLFVSFDFCCRGAQSTYKIAVGRSEKVNGPYLDRAGKKMVDGGGTIVLAGNETYPGVGHSSAYTFDGKDYLFAHAYNATANGRSELVSRQIIWDSEGWPTVSW